MALAHGVPIVPVSIKGAESIWPAGQVFPRRGKLTITYHQPIPVERMAGNSTKSETRALARQLAKQTHDRVGSGLDPASLPESDSTAALSIETSG